MYNSKSWVIGVRSERVMEVMRIVDQHALVVRATLEQHIVAFLVGKPCLNNTPRKRLICHCSGSTSGCYKGLL
jgi:hypothetical protein